MSEVLSQILTNLKTGRYQNEAAVRETIVLPILGNLGWQIYDPETVHREYPVQSRRVDYALFASGRTTPKIIIEVKAVGNAGAGDTQLFEYAFHAGVPMAILTDGQSGMTVRVDIQRSVDAKIAHELGVEHDLRWLDGQLLDDDLAQPRRGLLRGRDGAVRRRRSRACASIFSPASFGISI